MTRIILDLEVTQCLQRGHDYCKPGEARQLMQLQKDGVRSGKPRGSELLWMLKADVGFQANGGVLGQQLQTKGSDGPRPAWVSDWRLKLALADAKQFQVGLTLLYFLAAVT